MQLTDKELLILQDTDFLLTKVILLEKMTKLFEQTREELKQCVENSNFSFPDGTDLLSGKISRGENYKGLPYLVLDYPTLFSKNSTFAFRTMCWWGNFFSSTIHLEGIALINYKNSIINNLHMLLQKDIYICVADNPWQYHYNEDNYLPLSNAHNDFISNCEFLKLSKKIELKNWNDVPKFSADFFSLLLPILKLSK